MGYHQNTPVIIGIGEICNRSTELKDALEPAELITRAIFDSIEDAGAAASDIISQIDSISIVPPWTWVYDDLPALVAEKLGAKPSHTFIAEHGGNQPGLLCDEAARRVASGESRVALVAGGEALMSLAACRKLGHKIPPGWTVPNAKSSPYGVGDLSILGNDVGAAHSIGLPIHVYPLYENGRRAHKRQTFNENDEESAGIYAAFDDVACSHPYAWRYGQKPRSADAIKNVTKENRLICMPYPLLMNAFNTVNMSAACMVTTVELAERLGVPREKWVYVLGGAGTRERESFWERPNYHSSPALTQAFDAAMDVSGLTKDDIDCFDFYSCFPIVPKLACEHFGLDPVRPSKRITLLGGLNSFGGAGNNYSMHAITEMARLLRKKTFRNGLVLANGGVLTYQHVICLSSQPRKGQPGYPTENPLPKYANDLSSPPFDERAEGPAIIETYTVEFSRNGAPRLGHVVGRLEKNGHRFIANHGDDVTLAVLSDHGKEPIGLQGSVKPGSDGRNLFFIRNETKL